MTNSTPFVSFLQHVATDLHNRFRGDYSHVTIVFPNKRASLFLNEQLLNAADNRPIWAPQYKTISELFLSLTDRSLCDPIECACRIYNLYVSSEATQRFLQEAKESAETQNHAFGQDFSLPTLDEFFGWAERILADFEDIDKNLAPANLLFQNLSDLRKFDTNEFLNEKEIEALQRFFNNFQPEHRKILHERYQLLWDQLGNIYQQLNNDLAAEGRAYEGALYRHVVEQLKNGDIQTPDNCSHYVFVGFNVLDKVEQALFNQLKKANKALFYWDFDDYYTDTKDKDSHFEAGLFLRQNLLQFPNALKGATDNTGRSIYDNLRHIEQIEIVSASSEVAQAQSVATWLQAQLNITTDQNGKAQLQPGTDLKKTAIVLCNENMLHPVLHALPEGIEHVNITKGFPLAHTEIADIVEQAFGEWEKMGSDFHAETALRQLRQSVEQDAMHYEERREQLRQEAYLNSEAKKPNTDEEKAWNEPFERILQSESYLLMCNVIDKLLRLTQQINSTTAKNNNPQAETFLANINATTLHRLLQQIVRQQSIPFLGEPVVGLQVMGILETRCLDFENVIMLSVNEGALPKISNDNSFIPYLLRRYYELTTPERRTAVYAYYFYRLIQRSKHLRLCYNSSSEGTAAGEMSRFITQLMVESKIPNIEHKVLVSKGRATKQKRKPIPKPSTDYMLEKLTKGKSKQLKDNTTQAFSELPRLSPSAITSYLRCQQSFYYKYILGIREPKAVTDEMPTNIFGSIFHRSTEIAYRFLARDAADRRDFSGAWMTKPNFANTITPSAIQTLINDKRLIESFVQHAFNELQEPYRILEANAIKILLKATLRYDLKTKSSIEMKGTEINVYGKLSVKFNNKEQPIDICIGGQIDHLSVSTIEGKRRLDVIDYKTGKNSKKDESKDLDELFELRGNKHKGYMLQIMTYATILLQNYPELVGNLPVAPQLLFVNNIGEEKYTPHLKLGKVPKGGDKSDTFVLDFDTLRPDFEERLETLIAEMLDSSEGACFEPCDDPQCLFCTL